MMTACDGLCAVARVTPRTTPPDQKGMCTCRNSDVSGPTPRVSPSPLSTAIVPPPSPCLLGAGPTGEEHLSSCVSLSSSAVPVLPHPPAGTRDSSRGHPSPRPGGPRGPQGSASPRGARSLAVLCNGGRAGHVCRGLVCGGRRHGDDHLHQCGRGCGVFLCEPRAAHPVGRGSRAQERHAATRRMGGFGSRERPRAPRSPLAEPASAGGLPAVAGTHGHALFQTAGRSRSARRSPFQPSDPSRRQRKYDVL